MAVNGPRVTSINTSVFLDCLRLLAALTVLVGHAYDQWFPTKSHLATNRMGHVAVVIFFVLSGYVIAHTTASKNRGASQYIQARLSRLYSGLIPALLISIGIQFIVKLMNPSLFVAYTRGASWPRYFLSSIFQNEIWFLSAAPPINSPLWSLSYEFWYYTIFGLWFYGGNSWKKILFPLLACFIAGPKILLLMPVWLFGCVTYHLPKPIIFKAINALD